MPYEEDKLAILEAGRLEFEHAEVLRHARYAAEDAETARRRADDDRRAAEGVAQREAVKATLEAAIAARPLTAEAVAAERMTAIMAKMDALQQKVEAAVKPADERPAA